MKISWVGKQVYKLEGISFGYYYIFHILLLEPYVRGTTTPPSINLPLLENNQLHYIPEKIITYGKENEKTLFWIAWKGNLLDKAI